MDLRKFREYPVVGDAFFSEPRGGLYAWVFFGFSVLFSVVLLVDRGAKVALFAGGGLVLLAFPQVLPEEHYRTSVILRIVAVLYYVALWVVIFVVFPDTATFFEGNW